MENKFELLHLGIKTDDPVKAEETARLLAMMFNLEVKMGNSSNFAGKYFECTTGCSSVHKTGINRYK